MALEDGPLEMETGVPPPARPRRMRARIEDGPDALVLSARTGNPGATLFLAFWLTGWSVGCYALARQLIDAFTLFMLLFAIPFFAAWIYVALTLWWMLLGHEVLRLDADGLHLRRSAIFGRWRTVPLEDLRGVKAAAGKEIEIETAETPVRFGSGLKEDEREWIAALLQERIAAATARLPSATFESSTPAVPGLERDRRARRGLWIEDDFDRTVVRMRGKWSLGGLAGIAFICCFWNGIVSVFVWKLVEDFQWFLALFLVPFVAIGLAIVAAFLLALFAPFIGATWTFGRDECVVRSWFLGLGRSRPFEFGTVRVEKRRPARQADGEERKLTAESGRRRIAFIDRDGVEAAAIELLTEAQVNEILPLIRKWRPGAVPAQGAH